MAVVLPTPTALPVTLGEHRAPVLVEEALAPGDEVLLHPDGITEARSPAGEAFVLLVRWRGPAGQPST